jgi:hypothetical protein
MIAAVLKRHPHLTVRKLLAHLDREFGGKFNNHAVTGKLYTRRDLFKHTPAGLSANRPVTWSLN